MCVVVFDLEREGGAEKPWSVLTGDTLFIGEVGRPDLSPVYSPHQLAAMLFDSLHNKLLALPDSTLVYPAHGAGSLCGRAISEGRSTTIGQERAFNYALQPRTREEFVELITSDFPDRPEYFLRDAEINRTGATPLTDLPEVPAMDARQVIRRQERGGIVLDTRTAAEFGAGSVPGSIHIGLAGQFASWAGTLIGLDTPLVLVVAGEQQLLEARMRLARVGMENVVGYLGGKEGAPSAYGIVEWQRAGHALHEVPQITVLDLYQQMCDQPDEVQVVDVRRRAEWEAGHLERARLKPLAQFRSLLNDLDPGRPLAVHCKSGYRSSIATSLLLRAGFSRVYNVIGGFDAWAAQKLPSLSGAAARA
jgi:rhodanese-related sulfurtransferase